MIYVTRLNGEVFAINPDLIEFIDSTPDTVISMTTGKKIVVSESIDEIIVKIIKYKRKIYEFGPYKPYFRRNEV
ncbi:MAG: flagellar protein FlbD [Candidatus Petromonas sp.]|nr:flagellar protein FlbD [Candidatus Petromonas sp.]